MNEHLRKDGKRRLASLKPESLASSHRDERANLRDNCAHCALSRRTRAIRCRTGWRTLASSLFSLPCSIKSSQNASKTMIDTRRFVKEISSPVFGSCKEIKEETRISRCSRPTSDRSTDRQIKIPRTSVDAAESVVLPRNAKVKRPPRRGRF